MNSSRLGVDEQDPVALPLDEQCALLWGLGEQFPVGVDVQDLDRSSWLGVDEQDAVEGWMTRTTPWRAG